MTFLTTHPPHITFNDVVINVIFWALVIGLFRNRKKSEDHNRAWRIMMIFLGVLVATLGINYAKKSVKDWWEK
jgi:hypothetical protein